MDKQSTIGCNMLMYIAIMIPWIASSIVMFMIMDYWHCAFYLFGTGVLTRQFTYLLTQSKNG